MSLELQPADPAWETRSRRIFEAAPFIAFVGCALKDLRPGRAACALELRPEHLQQDGVVHAGVQATMADHTAGTAAATLLPPDLVVLTTDFKISLLRAARGERLVCRAEVIKAGRAVTFAEARVFALEGGQERLVSTASVTLAFTPAPRPTPRRSPGDVAPGSR